MPSSDRFRSLLRQIPRAHSLLDLGCADGREALIYREIFGGIQIIGVDLDAGLLRKASGHKLHCCLASVAALPFPAVFDLVVVRHPDVDRGRQDWQPFFAAAGRLLISGGILLVTAYHAPEIDQIRQWVRANTCLTPFPLAQLAPPGLDGRDRYALVYRLST